MKLVNVTSTAANFASVLETSHSANGALLSLINALINAQSNTADFEELAKQFGEAVYEAAEGLGVSPESLKVYVSYARRIVRHGANPDCRKLALNTEKAGQGIQKAASLMPSRNTGAGKPSNTKVLHNSGAVQVDPAVSGITNKTVAASQGSGVDAALLKLRTIAARDTNMESLILLMAKHAEHAEEIGNWLVTAKLGRVEAAPVKMLKAA